MVLNFLHQVGTNARSFDHQSYQGAGLGGRTLSVHIILISLKSQRAKQAKVLRL